jgi:hypothetical protein
VLDPSAFRSDGGPTIAQRLTLGSGGKIHFRPADNTRVPGRGAMGGWDQVLARLIGDADGHPMMVCFSTCRDSIRNAAGRAMVPTWGAIFRERLLANGRRRVQ